MQSGQKSEHKLLMLSFLCMKREAVAAHKSIIIIEQEGKKWNG